MQHIGIAWAWYQPQDFEEQSVNLSFVPSTKHLGGHGSDVFVAALELNIVMKLADNKYRKNL